MKFNEIIGHEDVKKRLKSMVDNDHIPHALLIYGEPGVGKLALARALAQYIQCSNHSYGDSCGVCPSCVQHQTFNHTDTFYIYPVVKKSSSVAVSDDYAEEWRKFIQSSDYENFEKWTKSFKNENAQPKIFAAESVSLIHKMTMASLTTRYKIAIVWLPEKMEESCANKLLKIIEEPYPDSLFIFVCDNPKELLPTIYSRTQRIEVRRLSVDDISRYLQNKNGIEPQQATAIAAIADGNMVKAEEYLMLDSEVKVFFKSFVEVMRMAYTRDIKGLKKWSESINNFKREKEKRFMEYCSRMLRENFIYNLHKPSLNYLTSEEEAFSKKFSPFINERNVEDMISEFNKASRDIQGNANGKIVMFDLALKITKLIKK